MADIIAQDKTGRDLFAFNSDNGVPWHFRGVPLKGLSTAEEMMIAAGLNFRVKTVPAEFGGVQLKNFRWVINADTNRVYTCVKNQYEVLQNDQLFHFLDAVISKGEAVYETAGALMEGAVCFAAASLPNKYYICDDDPILPYVVTALSHNKLLPFVAFSCITRPVCWNTLSAAMNEAKHGAGIVKIPHRGGAKAAIKAAPSALGLAINDIEALAPVYRDLARKPMTVAQFNEFVQIMMPSKRDTENKEPTKLVKALRDYLFAAWDAPINNLHQENRHTGWTAMNTVTQFVDHYEPAKTGKKKAVNPGFRSWFGTGPAMRAKAMRVLSKMLLKKQNVEDEKYTDGLAEALMADTAALCQRPEAQLLTDFPLLDTDEDANPLPGNIGQ